MAGAGALLVDFAGVEKSYGAVRALDGVDFSVSSGRMRRRRRPQRRRQVDADACPERRRRARPRPPRRSPARSSAAIRAARAKALGLRPVLPGALALPEPDGRRERADRPSVDPADSAGASGRGGSSATSSTRSFPATASRPDDLVQDLSIGRRQMVEIARAFTRLGGGRRASSSSTSRPPRSTPHTAGQLLAYVRGAVAVGDRAAC